MMSVEYSKVDANGKIAIPVNICRKFNIYEGTRVAFLEEEGRLIVQPIVDGFIDEMKGSLRGRGLPGRIGRSADRNLR